MIAPAEAAPLAAGPAAPPALRGAVAVLVSRFPLVTETFILREIVELERQGQPVLLVPLLRQTGAVVHADAAPWIRRALYTPFLSGAVLASVLRMWRRRPLGLPLLLGRLVAGTLRSLGMLARTLAHVPRAIHIAERLEAEGIRHIHAHFATHPATAALIAHELTGISFSVTAHAHDIFVDHALLPWKLARAAFVRVISRYNAAYLEGHWPAQTAGKLRVIHVGVDWRAYARAPRAVGGGERILCVAALKSYKGIPVLIEACRRLRERGVAFDCDIVGDGPLRPSLERRIRRAGLSGHVRLLGAQPQEEVRRRIGEASVFVLSSVVATDGQMEGIPVALMEAMAAGVPVVASRLSGIPELVVDGQTGTLVEPGDSAALADALAGVLGGARAGLRMAEAGARKVRADFTLEGTVAALLEELDGANPPLCPELQSLVTNAAVPLQPGRVGVRRVHERTDSRVLELVLGGRVAPLERDRSADARARELILKVQRPRPGESRSAPERARREFAVLSFLQPARVEQGPECRVPEPLQLAEDAGAVLMEACSGEPLDRLIQRARGSRDPRRFAALLEAVRLAGVWLRELQTQTPSEASPSTAIAEVLARARVDLAACAGVTFSSTEAAAVHARLRSSAEQAERAGERLVGRHGDFWPGNIFIGEDAVEAIDFEGFGMGVPEEDAAWFLVHLELAFARPWLAPRARRAAAAFLDGLGAQGAGPLPSPLEDPGQLPALRLCRTAAALTLLARADGRPRSVRDLPRRRALRAMVLGV